jgi:hypothetical protein
MNSRQKGARGEREAAKKWEEVMGGKARRGQQFAGGTDSPDIVISNRAIHVEVKRTERGNPYEWLDQAKRDAKGKVPVVLHRRSNRPWVLLMEFADAPKFLMAAQDVGQAEAVGAEEVPHTDAGQGVPPAGEEE